jgi:hypothetical protein
MMIMRGVMVVSVIMGVIVVRMTGVPAMLMIIRLEQGMPTSPRKSDGLDRIVGFIETRGGLTAKG